MPGFNNSGQKKISTFWQRSGHFFFPTAISRWRRKHFFSKNRKKFNPIQNVNGHHLYDLIVKRKLVQSGDNENNSSFGTPLAYLTISELKWK
jgi:hypothetical protein